MSALDVVDDEDLETFLRVELDGSVDLATSLRFCVNVFCFIVVGCQPIPGHGRVRYNFALHRRT
jgi:hypothetical protein